MALKRTVKLAELVQTMRDGYAHSYCICSKPKERREPFCRRCFSVIPRDIRGGLRSSETNVLAESYRDSVYWLEDNMYIRTGCSRSLFGREAPTTVLPRVLKRSKPLPAKSRIIVFDDGREKCVGEEWEKRRQEVHDRAQSMCENLVVKQMGPSERDLAEVRCGRYAPLHDEKSDDSFAYAGHAHHRSRRKVRDDRKENLLWVCRRCHKNIHGGTL